MKLPNAYPKSKQLRGVREEKVRPSKPRQRKPLKRTRLKSRGPRTKKSGGHAFPKNVDEAYREWIRALPCLLLGRTGHYRCHGPVQVCHVKSRGAGGPDRQNVVPMCAGAHGEQHCYGIRSFEQRYGLNLKATARQLTEVYEAERFPCP